MNEVPLWILVLLLILCLALSAFFSASETAMMSLNRYRLKHLSESGHQQAKRASKLLEQPERLIGTILLGNNFVNIAATSIGTMIGLRLFGDLGVLIATIFLTVAVLLFSEVTPKTIAAIQSQKIAFPSSYPLSILVKILSPLVFLLNKIAAFFLKILGFNVTLNQEEALSNEELKTIVLSSSEQTPDRREMLMSVFELEDITVSEAMVNRNDLQGIDLNDEWEDILQGINNSEHGRLIAYYDNLDQVEGLLHLRDLVKINNLNKEALVKILRPCVYVPENTPLRTQLLNFQKQRARSALVVDEYGDLKGMITLEDILTRIIGDIDEEKPSYTKHQEALYTVEGSISLRQLNKDLGLKFPLDGPNTLSGLIIETLGNFPEEGAIVPLDACSAKVLKFSDGIVELVELNLNIEE